MTKIKKERGHRLIKTAQVHIPGDLTRRLEEQAKILIETVLTPSLILSAPESICSNDIVKIYTKWHGHFFFFCAEYRRPFIHARESGEISSESEFARLEYVGDVRFNLSYLGHTGKWEKIFIDLTIEECMEAIGSESFFYPSPPLLPSPPGH